LSEPAGRGTRVPHPIEAESYAILRARLDTRDLPPLTRAVVERIVHTTADPSWAGELVGDEPALRSGRSALLAGAPLIADVRMVAAGITGRPAAVALDMATADDVAAAGTRSAAGIRAAARQHPVGAVWVIGNAPTALAELLACAAQGLVSSPLVIGLPVGFVGAVAAKAALRAAGLPALSNRTERGGAAVAVAAVNALLYAQDAP
jgi:precorrin-8X/cobalt-precorrin-8 methylmutase